MPSNGLEEHFGAKAHKGLTYLLHPQNFLSHGMFQKR